MAGPITLDWLCEKTPPIVTLHIGHTLITFEPELIDPLREVGVPAWTYL